MEALLCDEQWLTTPAGLHIDKNMTADSVCSATQEDDEQAILVCLQKESSYMPEPHYVEFIERENLVSVRFRCVHWFNKIRSRWNLSNETFFLAANYLDRFISMNRHKEWKDWMVELLAIACLSVACKFNETYPPNLREIQMENLDHLFQSSAIERMELTLLQALEWRLSSPTTSSYIKLLRWKLDAMEGVLGGKLVARITELLVGAVSDLKLMGFRPSVIAVCAVWSSIDLLAPVTSEACLSCITRLFNLDQKEEVKKCRTAMEAYNQAWSSCCPESPTSVLMKQRFYSYDDGVSLQPSASICSSPISMEEEIERETL